MHAAASPLIHKDESDHSVEWKRSSPKLAMGRLDSSGQTAFHHMLRHQARHPSFRIIDDILGRLRRVWIRMRHQQPSFASTVGIERAFRYEILNVSSLETWAADPFRAP